jgi:hypothetical protein
LRFDTGDAGLDLEIIAQVPRLGGYRRNLALKVAG